MWNSLFHLMFFQRAISKSKREFKKAQGQGKIAEQNEEFCIIVSKFETFFEESYSQILYSSTKKIFKIHRLFSVFLLHVTGIWHHCI
ncbi:MAG: hypothetical protein Ct9H90mP5_09700 [Acidimicrobiaceae bacterium]|nr:MAG: hypothetical protein Ct9H90mP5_09700 [Acidimicrobiaceae bacterium]